MRDAARALLTRDACHGQWMAEVSELLNVGPDLTIQDAREFAAERLLATGRLHGLSPERIFALWERFEKFGAAFGGITRVSQITPEVATAFVNARGANGRPSGSTQSLRRTALRLLFRVLREYGLMDGEPTLDLEVARRAHRDMRPLADEELEEGRWASATGAAASRATAVWALAESGLWPHEVAIATVDEIDVAAQTVAALGGPKTRRRFVPLRGWALDQLVRRAEEVGTGRLVFDGAAGVAGRLSITAVLRRVLERAGLTRDPLVVTDSVVAAAGRAAYEATGRIDNVARLLGLNSLDRAAHLIALDWQAEGQ
ncbi:MAG TPA: hypothetical protein VF230_16590 [Acidimicrobiales bacterium]